MSEITILTIYTLNPDFQESGEYKEGETLRLQDSSARGLVFRIIYQNPQKFFTLDELWREVNERDPNEESPKEKFHSTVAVESAIDKLIVRGIVAYQDKLMLNPREDYADFLNAKKRRPVNEQKMETARKSL